MTTITHKAWLAVGLVACAGFILPIAINAQDLPMSGMYVPELQVFDDTMQDFMAARGIQAGLLGIMKDGCIVYERGFGWRDFAHTEALPEADHRGGDPQAGRLGYDQAAGLRL